MQIKNWLLFIASCILLFIVHGMLMRKFFPEKPKPPAEEKVVKEPVDRGKAVALPIIGAGSAALSKMEEDRAAREQMARRWREQLPWGSTPVQARRGNARPALITLGSSDSKSDYHLEVTLDPRGAGIHKVVLNKFKKASSRGLPVDEPLVLVPPPDPRIPVDDRVPSNALFHYDLRKIGETDTRPLITLGQRDWEVAFNGERDGRRVVEFVTTIAGVKVVKEFSLAPGEYHVALAIRLATTGQETQKFRYQLAGSQGMPIEGEWYSSTYRTALIGKLNLKKNSLSRTYQDSREIGEKGVGDQISKEAGKDAIIQYAAVAIQYFASVVAVDDTQDKRDFVAYARATLEKRADLVTIDEPPQRKDGAFRLIVQDPDDRSKKKTYFLTPEVFETLALLPRGRKVGLLCVPTVANAILESDQDRLLAIEVLPESRTQPLFLDDITVRLTSDTVDLKPGQETVHRYVLYHGPVKAMLLGQDPGNGKVSDELVERYVSKLRLNTLTDYHSPGAFGNIANFLFWTDILVATTNLMHRVLYWLHSIVPSYGLCIILLTFMVRALMFPISRKQALTSLKMQELAPELKKLRDKYGNNRQEFAVAQMELFRKHKVNPFGTCWLLLLQMPIFLGLYYSLQESVHFRLAKFLWMPNLAAPDMLWYWGEEIPLISRPENFGRFPFLYLGPYFNLLPVLAVVLMWIHQSITMPPPTDEQQAFQFKLMKGMMILFAVIFYRVPAGLCLYFVVSTLWGFAERKFLPKKKQEDLSAEAMYRRLVAEEAAKKAEMASAVQPSTAITTEPRPGKKSKKREERERRRQERGQSGKIPASDSGEAKPPAKQDEPTGFFARARKWWEEVLKQAEKKP